MQPHQQRVLEERAELQDRIEALDRFITTNQTFANLPQRERDLLATQLVVMRQYFDILTERMKGF
jgi:hypothetical protein